MSVFIGQPLYSVILLDGTSGDVIIDMQTTFTMSVCQMPKKL